MKSLFNVLWKILKVSLFVVGALVVAGVVALTVLLIALPDGKTVADRSVLVFDLNTQITDRPAEDGMGTLTRLLGAGGASLQLRTATTALREAAKDRRISALYLHGNLESDGYSSGYAALRELREAVGDFRKSGKPVVAYVANAENRDYYLVSAAGQIFLNPLGVIAFKGLAMRGTFFKGAGDKYGVEFTPIRHGRFKSAIEPFIRQDFSPENREQMETLAKTIWGDVLKAAAGSRGIAPQDLQALVDSAGFIRAQQAKERGLVTDLAHEGAVIDRLRELAGVTKPEDDLPQVPLAEYARRTAPTEPLLHGGGDKVALVYAEGEILDGEGPAVGEGLIFGDRVARMLRALRKDKTVKAVVLRVNSPGGSAHASEVILDELRRIAADRPVVVSMGSVAASGGYYISTAASRIFAEPSTITGSIGVFGLSLNAQKLAQDHGVTFDVVKTGALADLGTMTRPMTDGERGVMTALVEDIYTGFVAHVARCRKMTPERVDEVAQGRVWSGADAVTAGLVDELGGLDAAIAAAAEQAKLAPGYRVVEYPPARTWSEILTEAMGGEEPLADADAATRIARGVARDLGRMIRFCDPHDVYLRLPFDLEFD